MLVWQEENLLAPLPCPSEGRLGVAGRADDTATFTAERLDGRRRIDVGDRHDPGRPHLLELLPTHLELVGRSHVGHRAAGGKVGQDDLLVGAAEHVSTLRHEVDTTEDDVLRIALRRGLLRQLERVAREVGELDDLVALVVVPQDQQPFCESRPSRSDPSIHLRI